MNVLLLGSRGFIGKNIAEIGLDKKYILFTPSRNEIDLLNLKQLNDYYQRNKIDVIVYSAFKPGHRNAKDFNKIIEFNLAMFYNTAKVFLDNKGYKFIS